MRRRVQRTLRAMGHQLRPVRAAAAPGRTAECGRLATGGNFAVIR